MSTSISIIKEETLVTLRDAFTKNAGNLIFRRVGRVFAKPEDLVQTVVETIVDGKPSTKVYPKGAETPVFSDKEWLQNVETQYQKFYFFTTTTSLRGNDRWGNIGIYGASNKYSELDVLDGSTFRWDRATTQIPPREGDLVCGTVSKNPGRANPEFKSWFICSEQFFHLWTAVLYAEHESITKDFADEDKIRRHLMSGNRLCTNGFRKWVLSCQQSMVESDRDQLTNRFYRLRTERPSKEFVHVYAALGLIMRYKELPGASNVPNNLDKGPKMNRWDLPDGWLDRVTKKYGLVISAETRDAIPAVRQMVPQGTHISILIGGDEPTNVDSLKETTKPESKNCSPRLNIDDVAQFPALIPPTPSSTPSTSPSDAEFFGEPAPKQEILV